VAEFRGGTTSMGESKPGASARAELRAAFLYHPLMGRNSFLYRVVASIVRHGPAAGPR